MGKKVYIKTGENNLEQVILESNLIDSENNLRGEFNAQIDKTAAELYDDVEQKFLTKNDLSDVFKIVDNEGNVGLTLDSNGLHALDFIGGIHKLSEKANNVDLNNHINNVQTHLRISDIINLINKHFQEQIKEGNNIDITDNTISAKGYSFNETLNSFAEGFNTTASGFYSHAEGISSHAEGYSSHTEGSATIGIGLASHAEGCCTTASGNNSHAEGDCTTASGNNSHSEGDSTIAKGSASHAEGSGTIGTGDYSHAEGFGSHSEGVGSHSEGHWSNALGNYSHTEGFCTKTNNIGEHAEGTYNLSNYDPDDSDPAYHTISSIGIGTSNTDRRNAVEVMKNGDMFVLGIGNYEGNNITRPKTLQNIINDNIYEIGEMPQIDCYAWYSQKEGIPDITMQCFWQTHGNYITVSLKNVKVITNRQDIYYSLPKQVYDGYDVSGVFVSYTSNEIIGWSTVVHEGVNVIKFRKTSGNFTTNNPGINITFQYRYK